MTMQFTGIQESEINLSPLFVYHEKLQPALALCLTLPSPPSLQVKAPLQSANVTSLSVLKSPHLPE